MISRGTQKGGLTGEGEVMKFAKTLTTLAIGLLLGTTTSLNNAHRALGANDAESLVTEFIQLSMLDEEAKQTSQLLKNLLRPTSKHSGADNQSNNFDPSLEDLLTAERIIEQAKGYLRREFGTSSTSELLERLRRPATQKVIRLGHHDKDQTQFDAFKRNLASNPLAIERVRLLQRLDAAMGTSEILLRRSLLVGQITPSAINSTLNPSHSEKYQQWGNSELLPYIKGEVLLANYFSYRSLSIEELTEHVEFAESPIGKWYSSLLIGIGDLISAKMMAQLHEVKKPEANGTETNLSNDNYQREVARSLNFQRLLAAEEKRTATLEAHIEALRQELATNETKRKQLMDKLQAYGSECVQQK